MKRLIIFLFLLEACIEVFSIGKARAITITQAVSYVEMTFYQYADADFYVGTDTIQGVAYWLVFVDEEPMKGWEHDCVTYHIPMTIEGSNPIYYFRRTSLRRPPQGISLSPFQHYNRYGNHSSDKPYVTSNPLINGNYSDAAIHTYAVIISGGISPISNHERYWNDCSYIYQTLVNRYGIPKSHIKVLMSDGLDPSSDMRLADGSGFVSSPSDLDFDNLPDINYSATKSNITQCFEDLNDSIDNNDHLFVFVIDHGTVLASGESAICLWNNDNLSSSELSSILNDCNAGYINIVMGQCHSGGFVSTLSQPGRVIATACAANQLSWGCYDIPYDEFVHWWTEALNEENPYTAGLSDKVYNNGPMTMRYAFAYAKTKDRYNETPQYDSSPLSVGEDLSFDSMPDKVSLYIKDFSDDTGSEPYEGDDYCNSPDIWVRNQHDGLVTQEHQNPYITEPQQILHVYVKMRNRGTEPYMGHGKFCKIYWQEAGLSMTKNSWLGIKDRTQDQLYGGPISRAEIRDTIMPGDSAIVHLLWPTEDMIYTLMQSENYRLHSCLLTKISDSYMNDSLEVSFNQLTVAVNQKRNIAQKNLMIFGPDDLMSLGTNGVALNVRNTYNMERAFNVEFHNLNTSTNIFEDADVYLNLSDGIQQAWEVGGYKAKGITYNNGNIVYLNSFGSRLENLILDALQLDKIHFLCNFNANNNNTTDYEFLILLRDSLTGNVIGSETFRIERGPTASLNGTVIFDEGEDSYHLTTSSTPGSYDCLWMTDDGHVISKGLSARRTVGAYEAVKARMVSKSDGSFVDLPVCRTKGPRIANVVNIGQNDLRVTLSKPVTKGTSLEVSSTDGMFSMEKTLDEGATTMAFPLPQTTSGTVVLVLKEKQIVTEQQKYRLK